MYNQVQRSKILRSAPTHTVFMCFVWITEKTAITSLYSINWLVFIKETECFLRGTSRVFKIGDFLPYFSP